MKKFLAIYMGNREGIDRWMSMDDATRQKEGKAGSDAWGKWVITNKAAISDPGGLLGKTQSITKKGATDTKNVMTAYTIVQAESHEDAAKLFADHPHFMFFPDDSIELMEIITMPQ